MATVSWILIVAIGEY